jgi:hypothetical protein
VETLAAAVAAPIAVAAEASHEEDRELESKLKYLKRMLDAGILTEPAYMQQVAKCMENF